MRFRRGSEIVIGLLYAMGTIHQAFFVLRESEAFYLDMADQAWIGFAESFIREVLVPNSVVVTVLVVVFQGVLAVAILSRRRLVERALIAGGVFSLVGAFTGNPAETVGYATLAAIHFWIASIHDEPASTRPN